MEVSAFAVGEDDRAALVARVQEARA